jgi:hypothetical protein
MGKSIVHSKENDHDSSHENIKVEKGKNKILWKITKHKRDPTGFNIMHLHWGYLLQDHSCTKTQLGGCQSKNHFTVEQKTTVTDYLRLCYLCLL